MGLFWQHGTFNELNYQLDHCLLKVGEMDIFVAKVQIILQVNFSINKEFFGFYLRWVSKYSYVLCKFFFWSLDLRASPIVNYVKLIPFLSIPFMPSLQKFQSYPFSGEFLCQELKRYSL
jgi:hypothetical protein